VIKLGSCRARQKRGGKDTKTCPAGFGKTFPILYENQTEMQPWIYSLYLEGH